MRSSWLSGFLLSSSWISMARKSSLLSGPPFFRTARCRTAVSVWATVSATPPNTYTCCQLVSNHISSPHRSVELFVRIYSRCRRACVRMMLSGEGWIRTALVIIVVRTAHIVSMCAYVKDGAMSYLVAAHSSCCTCGRGVKLQPFGGGRRRRAVTAVADSVSSVSVGQPGTTAHNLPVYPATIQLVEHPASGAIHGVGSDTLRRVVD